MIIDLSNKGVVVQAFVEFNQIFGMLKANVDFGEHSIKDAFPIFCSIVEELNRENDLLNVNLN